MLSGHFRLSRTPGWAYPPLIHEWMRTENEDGPDVASGQKTIMDQSAPA